MSHNFKNDDGTVNFGGLQNHLDFVKGKYAQNAKNYEANTGQSQQMGSQGASTEQVKGEMRKKKEEPTTDLEAKDQASS